MYPFSIRRSRCGVVLPDLFRLIVRRAVNVNRCVGLAIEEVGLGEVTRDPVLGICWAAGAPTSLPSRASAARAWSRSVYASATRRSAREPVPPAGLHSDRESCASRSRIQGSIKDTCDPAGCRSPAGTRSTPSRSVSVARSSSVDRGRSDRCRAPCSASEGSTCRELPRVDADTPAPPSDASIERGSHSGLAGEGMGSQESSRGSS